MRKAAHPVILDAENSSGRPRTGYSLAGDTDAGHQSWKYTFVPTEIGDRYSRLVKNAGNECPGTGLADKLVPVEALTISRFPEIIRHNDR